MKVLKKYFKILVFILFFSVTLQATEYSRQRYRSLPTTNLVQTAKNAFLKAFDAADYYDHRQFKKRRWMVVSDFSQNSANKRGYLIDFRRKKIISFYVTHGENSGDGNGNAVAFSNIEDSHQSSLGLYQTAQRYSGQHGKSMRLVGVESTNDNAYDRYIVIHSANYANQETVDELGHLGPSWGCPAVDRATVKILLKKMKRKNFYYIYHEKFSNL